MDSSSEFKTFHEVQQFRQAWLWLLLFGMGGLFWYIGLKQLLQRDLGPGSDWVIFLSWLFCGLLLPLFFHFTRLVTEVRRDGIYVQFFPLHLSFRRIGFEEIRSVEIRTYSPISEYGGWGIRYGPGGKAYNVSGNKGLQLALTNGKKLLIGTQLPEEFLDAVTGALGPKMENR